MNKALLGIWLFILLVMIATAGVTPTLSTVVTTTIALLALCMLVFTQWP